MVKKGLVMKIIAFAIAIVVIAGAVLLYNPLSNEIIYRLYLRAEDKTAFSEKLSQERIDFIESKKITIESTGGDTSLSANGHIPKGAEIGAEAIVGVSSNLYADENRFIDNDKKTYYDIKVKTDKNDDWQPYADTTVEVSIAVDNPDASYADIIHYLDTPEAIARGEKRGNIFLEDLSDANAETIDALKPAIDAYKEVYGGNGRTVMYEEYYNLPVKDGKVTFETSSFSAFRSRSYSSKFTPAQETDFVMFSKNKVGEANAGRIYVTAGQGWIYNDTDFYTLRNGWKKSGPYDKWEEYINKLDHSETRFTVRSDATEGDAIKITFNRSNGDNIINYYEIVKEYTLNFNTNGSSTANYSKMAITGETVSFSTPAGRTGYNWGGWYDNSSFSGNAISSYTPVKGNSTTLNFYAKWNPINYNITYNLNGGSVSGNPTTYNIETATFTLKNPTKTGYTFTGWTGTGLSSASTSVSVAKGNTGDRSYTANWTPNTYYVAFDGNGATSGSMSNQTFKYDTAQALSANGYARAYTVSYNYMSGSGSPASATATATFGGWTGQNGTSYSNGQSVSNLTATANATFTMTANWTLGSVTLPTPTRTGYTFDGWYIADEGGTKIGNAGASYTPTANITLYAHWNPNIYKVTLDNQGATTAGTTQYWYMYEKMVTAADGEILYYYSDPSCTTPIHHYTMVPPTKTGYTFEGYFTETNGGGTQFILSSGECTNNIFQKRAADTTLYAKWTPIDYSISYNLDGGSVSGNPTTYNIETATFALKNPTKTGYTFAGWTGTGLSSATMSVSIAKGSIGDRSYKATWYRNDYTIRWVNHDGAELYKATVKYQETPTYGGATPTKASSAEFNYTFSGWSPSVTAATDDATYTAQYTATTREYPITFKNEDGTVLELKNVKYGLTPTYAGATPQKAPTVSEVYTFAGWNVALSPVTGEAEYSAVFSSEPRKYTVVWVNDDGSVLATDSVAYGGTPSYSGATPEKEKTRTHKYEFANAWEPEIKLVDGDATYKALFNEIELPSEADLTIVTSGCDPEQSFVFEVASLEDAFFVPVEVAIIGNGQATIKGLPVGDYEVIEEDAWTWRFGNFYKKRIFVEAEEENTVTFKDIRIPTIAKWLSGLASLFK